MTRILMTLALLLTSISALRAESVQEAVVTLFKEICLVPNTPEAMMAAGRNVASERKWSLDEEVSGRKPFFLMGHVDPTGAPFYIVEGWNFSLPAVGEAKFSVWIVGPENPDVTHSLCGVRVAGRHVDSVARELETQLGGKLLRTKAPGQPEWFVSRDGKTIESCGKTISVSSYAPQTTTSLTFLDVKFPNTEKWRVLAAGFQRCDNRLEGN